MSNYPDSIDKITKARLRFSAFGSIVSIALTMFFVGILATLAVFSTRLVRNLSENVELEILFFSPATQIDTTLGSGMDASLHQRATESDIINYELLLKTKPYVAESRVSSRAANTAAAKEAVGNNYEEVIANPINASIFIKLKPEYTQADSLNKVISEIKHNEQVQDIVVPNVVVGFVQKNLQKFQWIVIGICVVFLFITLHLIANSIRLNIYAKRFNIKSMLLIGATRHIVRKPFAFKGFIQGVWGGFFATILVGLVLNAGKNFAPNFISLTSSDTLLIVGLLGGTFIFSILFTTLSAIAFTNRYIKINNDRLYL